MIHAPNYIFTIHYLCINFKGFEKFRVEVVWKLYLKIAFFLIKQNFIRLIENSSIYHLNTRLWDIPPSSNPYLWKRFHISKPNENLLLRNLYSAFGCKTSFSNAQIRTDPRTTKVRGYNNR